MRNTARREVRWSFLVQICGEAGQIVIRHKSLVNSSGHGAYRETEIGLT